MAHPHPDILAAIRALPAKTAGRKIRIEQIIRAIPGTMDMARESAILAVLKYLEARKELKLPSKKGNGWQQYGILPQYVTLARAKEDKLRSTRKTELACLRERTPWEPSKMAAFAHTLTTKAQLNQAVAVNRYLLNRKKNAVSLPHRERALKIFGNEKALDNYVHKGLFGGRIILDDLDCFYCPEPLPYELFSLDMKKTRNRPLILVENSATYWSCCAANRASHPLGGGYFSAVVFGKGFKASTSTPIQSLDGLGQIERQTQANGILYFGDLDPAGLAIPKRINDNRKKHGQPSLRPAQSLYRALIEKNVTTGYEKSQDNYHDAQWVNHWLAPDLAAPYLEQFRSLRWPQEGLTADDIARALTTGQRQP